MIEGLAWGLGALVFSLVVFAASAVVVWRLIDSHLASELRKLSPWPRALVFPWIVWVSLCIVGARKTFANLLPEMLFLGSWSSLLFAIAARAGVRLSNRASTTVATCLATAAAIALWRFFPMLLE